MHFHLNDETEKYHSLDRVYTIQPSINILFDYELLKNGKPVAVGHTVYELTKAANKFNKEINK